MGHGSWVHGFQVRSWSCMSRNIRILPCHRSSSSPSTQPSSLLTLSLSAPHNDVLLQHSSFLNIGSSGGPSHFRDETTPNLAYFVGRVKWQHHGTLTAQPSVPTTSSTIQLPNGEKQPARMPRRSLESERQLMAPSVIYSPLLSLS